MNNISDDIPKKEVLQEKANSLDVNFGALIDFRQKYNGKEITDFIINHKYFKKNSYSEISEDPYSNEVLIFLNAISSLMVTYDEIALQYFESVLKMDPGDLVVKHVDYIFLRAPFPDYKKLYNFILVLKQKLRLKENSFSEPLELLSYYISCKKNPTTPKRATPPEERESQK